MGRCRCVKAAKIAAAAGSLAVACAIGHAAAAQTVSPFDLVPRLDSAAAAASSLPASPGGGDVPFAPEASAKTRDARPRARADRDAEPPGATRENAGSGSEPAPPANPFDLVGRLPNAAPAPAPASETPPADAAGEEVADPAAAPPRRTGDVFAVFGLLVLLSATYVVQGGALRKLFAAAANANLLSRLRREQRWGAYGAWALLGAASVGLVVYVSVRELGYLPAGGPLAAAWTFVGGAIALTAARLLALTLLGAVFPLDGSAGGYRALVLAWVAALGVVVFPLAAFVSFAPAGLAGALAYVALAVVALAYALRALRAVGAAARAVVGYPLHFFLYLCALEIGPLAVAYKLLTG